MSAAIATAAISGFGSGDLAGLIPPAFTFRQSGQDNAEEIIVTARQVVPDNTYKMTRCQKPSGSDAELAVALVNTADKTHATNAQSHVPSAMPRGNRNGIIGLSRDNSKQGVNAVSSAETLNLAVAGAAISGKQSSGSNFVAIARDNYSASPTVRMAAPGGGGTAPPPPGEPDDPPLPLTGSTIVMLLLAAAYAHKPKAKGLLTNTNITN